MLSGTLATFLKLRTKLTYLAILPTVPVVCAHLGSLPDHNRAYAMRLDNHSNDSTFLRCAARTEAIREADYTSAELNLIGLKPSEGLCNEMSSLFAFVQALRKKSSESPPPLTEHGIEVVNPIFDPYRSCFFSPDHLLSGLAINILNTIFRLLPSAELRTYAGNLVCDALKSNRLIEQQQVHSMSLQGVFSVLLFSHASFTQAIVKA